MTGIVMHQYHRIYRSRIQLGMVLCAHLAVLPVIYFYWTPALLKWAGIAALALSASIEYRHLIRQGNMRLRIIQPGAGIELRQHGQPYFYFKYKVYQTRWFAILKLIDTRTHRTLILSSDCFASIDCYRRCRYDLRRLDKSDAT